MSASTARHETRALLRAHLAAASAYRHATRYCVVCHRLLRLAMEPGDGGGADGGGGGSGAATDPSGAPRSAAGRPDGPEEGDPRAARGRGEEREGGRAGAERPSGT